MDISYGAFLFIATACFVLRQNAHIAALWDFSFIIEHANRIALGDHPYRDFPFAYPPVTFLIQAAIIKLFGRAELHHAIYAAITAGASTLLAWRIIVRVLSASGLKTRLLALELTLPLVLLSTGGIFPQPWYDSDCTLIILFFLWLSLRMEDAEFPPAATLATGLLLALSIFVKQNTGGAFLVSFLFCLALYVLLTRRWRALLLAAGAFIGLAIAFLLIHAEVGLVNYFHWTLAFASSRRMPAMRDLRRPYLHPPSDAMYLLALGLLVWQWMRPRMRESAAAIMLAIPFVWAIGCVVRHGTPAARLRDMDLIWPFILLASLGVALWRVRRARSLKDLLPIAIFGMVNGALLSQGFGGSTFALWPFLAVLLAGMLRVFAAADGNASDLHPPVRGVRFPGRPMEAFAAFSCIALLGLGAFYTLTYARLSYVKLAGDPQRSNLAALRGLTTPGEFLPDLDELVSYSRQTIPQNDPILLLPGEDPFYYATGRRPLFPVLMFDSTINPYSPPELVELVRQRNVAWVIVKREYQLNGAEAAWDSLYTWRVVALLAPELQSAATLQNYTVYRVKR